MEMKRTLRRMQTKKEHEIKGQMNEATPKRLEELKG